jgi:hypothetical protein
VIVVGEYQGFFIFHTDAESIPYSVDACVKSVRLFRGMCGKVWNSVRLFRGMCGKSK